ncbi:uncharacterized protein SCHCODRAFT_02553861 [Schizophyllum commune H4-8]|nr:uncharacterized protein SCHCODRAFT_02553861 [Schizophyllum commune H4-8]KAI5886809.1 hypothetical protein SCHCODRAFT_02553861 [Schizophyllum commune H4-8]
MVAASTLNPGRALPDEIRLAIGENADRRTLCSLSLVSKAWMAITNELVWRSLPSLLPLLRLFPEDSREIQHGSTAAVKFRRPLTAEDWEPVLERSRLVRAIDMALFSGTPQPKVYYDRSVLEALIACPAPSSFLPHLESLVLPFDAFTSSKDLAEAVYMTLISSHLTTFGVSQSQSLRSRDTEHGEQTEWDTHLLEGIARACPKVSNLVLNANMPSSSLCTALERWTCLKVVRVTFAGQVDLDRIFGVLRWLPSLHSVEIDFGSGYTELTSPPTCGTYPPLKELTVMNVDIPLALAIMRGLGIRHLKVLRLLRVEEYYDQRDAEMMEMMQYIGSEGSSALSHVELRFDKSYCDLSFKHFSPLSALRNLRYLAISGDNTVITEAEYSDCARWWPDLRTFELDVTRAGAGCVECSLNVLIAFAEHCPHLEFLTVPLDATKSPPAIPQSLQHLALISLDVLEGAGISNLRQVALFLYNLFPNLEEVLTSYREWPKEYHAHSRTCWFTVNEIVNVLRIKEHGA